MSATGHSSRYFQCWRDNFPKQWGWLGRERGFGGGGHKLLINRCPLHDASKILLESTDINKSPIWTHLQKKKKIECFGSDWERCFQEWLDRETQHTHLFGLALPYKQAQSVVRKMATHRWAQAHVPQRQYPGRREGFFPHTLYIHVYVCISSPENHLGPAWDLGPPLFGWSWWKPAWYGWGLIFSKRDPDR